MNELTNPQCDRFVPDGKTEAEALKRTTHLAIVTHQDDLEILAYHGIKECYQKSDRWFTGIVVSDGAGSVRAGAYANFTDEQMKAVRREEQREAASLGEYSAVYQLDYPSAALKSEKFKASIESDLYSLLAESRPEHVYLHNPADSHDSHVSVFLRSIAALRALPEADRPRAIWGCEVWRDLDWLSPADKKLLPVSEYPDLAKKLCAVFDSQVSGGKRYDLATIARRQAHATFSASHEVDRETAITLAVDLTPLIREPAADIGEFTMKMIDRFKEDVKIRLGKFQWKS